MRILNCSHIASLSFLWLAAGCAQQVQSQTALVQTARAQTTQSDRIGQKIVQSARSQIGTQYTQEYFSLSYPKGDPPKHLGACTDVVIRALRPAGYDLQALIHNDMKRNFGLYPRKWGLRRTDKNIDHRRVPNQRKYFERFAQSVTTRASANTYSQWKAGDIVYWKLPGGSLDHTGIISDKRINGRPLVIHNLGGCREEDVLTQFQIVAHFRFPKR